MNKLLIASALIATLIENSCLRGRHGGKSATRAATAAV